MKLFETIDLAAKSQNYKLFIVFRYLESLLKGLDVPDVEGEQIATFIAQNISMDGQGTATIKVDTVEEKVEFVKDGEDSVYLRNNDGVLEFSNDNSTWTPVGGGGTGGGDMLKSVYDVSDNGWVDKAGKLTTNGTDFVEYGDVVNSLAHPTGEQKVAWGVTDYGEGWLPCGVGGSLTTIGDGPVALTGQIQTVRAYFY